MSSSDDDETIKEAVRDTYGGIARRFVAEGGTEGEAQADCGCSSEPASCCGPSADAAASTGIASGLYSAEELANLPEGATGSSLGCGNPAAIAELKPGEVVLDLGAGGGIDCFLAANKVGPDGKVIGLDMTTDMIRLARRNAKELGMDNVEFRYGEMEDIPLADESVDVIISNCVINLSPDKDAVFREAYRVLRPGGRISVSDIVVDGQLPEAVRKSLDAWASCVAGALEEGDYLDRIREAGFESVEVASRVGAGADLANGAAATEVLVVSQDGQTVAREDVESLLESSGLTMDEAAGMVVSIKVRATKPE